MDDGYVFKEFSCFKVYGKTDTVPVVKQPMYDEEMREDRLKV